MTVTASLAFEGVCMTFTRFKLARCDLRMKSVSGVSSEAGLEHPQLQPEVPVLTVCLFAASFRWLLREISLREFEVL